MWSLVFCILIVLFFVKYAGWPRHTFSLTAYAKVIVINAFSVCDQTSRQSTLKSKQPIFTILFLLLSQCSQIIDRCNFFLLTTRVPQSNLDYKLGQNRRNSKPHPPNQDQSRTKPRKSSFPSLILVGGGGGSEKISNLSCLRLQLGWILSVIVAGIWILHCIAG